MNKLSSFTYSLATVLKQVMINFETLIKIDSSGLPKNVWHKSQNLTLNSTLNLIYEFKVVICVRKDLEMFRCVFRQLNIRNDWKTLYLGESTLWWIKMFGWIFYKHWISRCGIFKLKEQVRRGYGTYIFLVWLFLPHFLTSIFQNSNLFLNYSLH